MNNNEKYDIFVSHCSSDKDFVRHLVNELKQYDLNIFFDESSIHVGQSILEQINDALIDCSYLLIVLTEDWLNSEWGKSESFSILFDDPSNINNRIIPIYLKTCKIPLLLRRFKYIDFRNPDNFNANFESLIYNFKNIIQEKLIQNIHKNQSASILKQSILPWTSHGGPNIGFIIPDLYIEPTIKPIKYPHSPLKFNDWLHKYMWNDNIAIIGSPGIGKTTLIKKFFIDYKNYQELHQLSFIPIFLTVKDIIEFKQSNSNNFSDFFVKKNKIEKYIKFINKYIFFVDGLDEISESYIEEIVTTLNDFIDKKDVLWIICRKDFFFNKLSIYENIFNKFYDVLEIQEWNIENDSMKFAKDYSIKYDDKDIIQTLIEIRNKFSNIDNFLKKPFEVTLILYLLSDFHSISENSFNSTYNLYKSFYNNWLQREQLRMSTSLNIEDVVKLHRNVALHLYNNRGKGITLDSVVSEVNILNSNLNMIKSDSAFWSLLITSKNGSSDIIERFWHETFGEFIIAENVIQSFLSTDNRELNDSLTTVYYNEINQFIREGFQQLDKYKKQIIYNNLSITYLKHFSSQNTFNINLFSENYINTLDISIDQIITNPESIRIREQILYYLGRLEIDYYPPILSFAARFENNPLLIRSAILGAILYRNENLEFKYLTSLIPGSEEDYLNRSVQLVYFGDAIGDLHSFRDNDLFLWDKVKAAILNRLKGLSVRDIALRWWDLRTLFCFFESRGWKDKISIKEYEIIQNTLCSSNLYSDLRNENVNNEKLNIIKYLNNNNLN